MGTSPLQRLDGLGLEQRFVGEDGVMHPLRELLPSIWLAVVIFAGGDVTGTAREIEIGAIGFFMLTLLTG